MWPRIHLDVLADSRNLGCPIAEPETIMAVDRVSPSRRLGNGHG
jgi:hypothetical protein